ncbi:hypothetical protein OGAPHI_000369 [Ogataea philodendri]|uniref:Protein BNI4 n=1 Tax=Ogataea philodendri TaxID=1378263 RepID=A0A9P8PHV9_9ASCO|nr:uncharacterized protein OGAPHI_000369 [Ogataea philodendri]KAH3671664.1 hypothetical protein OGAPHI_000369 [Ogataea philodendri]
MASAAGNFMSETAGLKAKIQHTHSPPYTQDSYSMSTVQDDDDFKNMDRSSSFQTSTSSSIREYSSEPGFKLAGEMTNVGFYSGPSMNHSGLNNTKHATHVRRSLVVSPSMKTIVLNPEPATSQSEELPAEEPTRTIGLANSPSLQALDDILNAKTQHKANSSFTAIQEEAEPQDQAEYTQDTVYHMPVNQSFASFFTAHTSTTAPEATDLISLSSTIKDKAADETPTLMTPNLFSPSMVFNEPVETFRVFDNNPAIPQSGSFSQQSHESSAIYEMGYDEQESYVPRNRSPRRVEQRYSMRLVDDSPVVTHDAFSTPVTIQDVFSTPGTVQDNYRSSIDTPKRLSHLEANSDDEREQTAEPGPEPVFVPQQQQEPQSVPAESQQQTVEPEAENPKSLPKAQEKELPPVPKNKRLSFKGLFKNKKSMQSSPSLATHEKQFEPHTRNGHARPKSFSFFEEPRESKLQDDPKDRRRSLLTSWKRKSLAPEQEKSKRKSFFGRSKSLNVIESPAQEPERRISSSDKENQPEPVTRAGSQPSEDRKSLLDTYGFSGKESPSDLGVVLSTPLESQTEFVNSNPMFLESPKFISPEERRASTFHPSDDVESAEIQAESDLYRLDTPSPVNFSFQSPEKPTLAPERSGNFSHMKRDDSFTRLLAGESIFPKSLGADEIESIVTLERSRSMRSLRSPKSGPTSIVHSDSFNRSIVEMINSERSDEPIVTADGMVVVRSPISSISSPKSVRRHGVLKQTNEPIQEFGMEQEELDDLYNMIQFGDDTEIDTDFHFETEAGKDGLEPPITFGSQPRYEEEEPSPELVPTEPYMDSPQSANWEAASDWEEYNSTGHSVDDLNQTHSSTSFNYNPQRFSMESTGSASFGSPGSERQSMGLKGPAFTPVAKQFPATRRYSSYSYEDEPEKDFEDYIAEASQASPVSQEPPAPERIRKSRRMSLIGKLNKKTETGSSFSRRNRTKSQGSIRLSFFGSKSSIDTRDLNATPMGSPMVEVPRVRFSSKILLFETYDEYDYDRKPDQATCNQLTPQLALQIKSELNELKAEMPVHELSKCYTQFF